MLCTRTRGPRIVFLNSWYKLWRLVTDKKILIFQTLMNHMKLKAWLSIIFNKTMNTSREVIIL
jgi:hypothetical protein